MSLLKRNNSQLMQFQMTLGQSNVQRFANGLRLHLTLAVYQPVVSIPAPPEFRERSRHPEIKCIVHEETGEHRAHYSALQSAAASLDDSYHPLAQSALSAIVRGRATPTRTLHVSRQPAAEARGQCCQTAQRRRKPARHCRIRHITLPRVRPAEAALCRLRGALSI